ncbi:MAG: hypoxanthine phosphoribosyltransferase [Bdellovibrionaceae bacterium]|nr:hypoxanthine phosphoribosyltransferase [Pseudobdellovibrionaceae bacterium]|tara:strand:+ start:4318 stop:4854 length:537 start_codon:yes stop_codon:yes gene_type:complete
MNPMDYTIEKFISEKEIKDKIAKLADQINADFDGKEIVAICTLKGSFVFFSDLIRSLALPVRCEFLGLSSYGNQTTTSGEVKVTLDLNSQIEGKHVLIVEDIVDSGITLQFILKYLEARNPASISTAALLSKPDALKVDVDVEYVGFEIQNQFVVGYGLDYAESLRGLPYIGILHLEE